MVTDLALQILVVHRCMVRICEVKAYFQHVSGTLVMHRGAPRRPRYDSIVQAISTLLCEVIGWTDIDSTECNFGRQRRDGSLQIIGVLVIVAGHNPLLIGIFGIHHAKQHHLVELRVSAPAISRSMGRKIPARVHGIANVHA